jgi:hypothetical protein
MKTRSLLAFTALGASILFATSCLQPSKTTQAQTKSLEDSLHFTQLQVLGNTVILRLAREGTADIRLDAAATPVDFPEYVTFAKSSTGSLTPVLSQTKMALSVSDAACADAPCRSLTLTLKRPGGTLGDTATIRATQIPSASCGISITEPNGAESDLTPTFTGGTLTSTLIRTGATTYDTDRSAFYGESTWTSPQTGLLTTLYLRNFVGSPSDLWFDEIDATVSNGTVARVGASVQTFSADNLVVGSASLDLFASDTQGRRVVLGCSTSTTISVPTPEPSSAPSPRPSPGPSPVP